jgi:hypothetical protein
MPPVFNDEKAIQDSESKCWNRKEIHGGNDLAMIGEKRNPALTRIAAAPQSP